MATATYDGLDRPFTQTIDLSGLALVTSTEYDNDGLIVTREPHPLANKAS